jgi:hypothetical protein
VSAQRDPDVVLAAWLDENAIPLPAETRHAIETAIRTIPQRRRPMGLPWRSTHMLTPLRLAAATALVVVVAVGALLVFRPTDLPGVGAPSPSPSPSASVAASLDPSTWTEYTSTEYGFTVKHPPDWAPWPEQNRIFFSGGADWGTGISVGRYPMGDASTPDAWLEANCGRAFAFAGTKPDPADGLVGCELMDGAAWAATTVDGHDAVDGSSSDNCCRDTVVFAEDQVYVITGWHNVAYDRPLFDAFVETLTLQP